MADVFWIMERLAEVNQQIEQISRAQAEYEATRAAGFTNPDTDTRVIKSREQAMNTAVAHKQRLQNWLDGEKKKIREGGVTMNGRPKPANI